MPFDVERARLETRHCDTVLHFNNAGSSLMPAPVADALRAYLDAEERMGGYETAAEHSASLERFYGAVGQLLNCAPHEVAYVENATRAWDMAFYSLNFAPGDRILTTVAEYGSNVIAYLQQQRKQGVVVDFVPNDDRGQIDVDALEAMIDERVKLISISHIPTGNGLVNPAAAVGAIANAAGVTYLLDSCQGVGHVPLDVKAIGCDLLSGTGRKYLRGPRGTGFLYVSERLIDSLEPPFLDQHSATLVSRDKYEIQPDARRFENWEQFYAGKAGLAVAVDYALSWGLDNIQRRVYDLAASLRQALSSIPGVVVTDQGAEQCGIVTFNVRPTSAASVQSRLREERINVSVSSGDGNFVLFEENGVDEVVRASVHYFNTNDEIDRFCTCVEATLSALR